MSWSHHPLRFFAAWSRLCLLALPLAFLHWSGRAHGQSPGQIAPLYQVLRPAGPRTPCNVIPTPVTPYAYGWFGASPRPQAERQFGIHRAFTQWRIH